MLDFLYTIFYFIIAIMILIAIHEFGHFWVAKKLGIKVLRFSIGFGKPIYSKRFGDDQTEFVIAAIPLGGYVKMLDERDSSISASEVHRAFNRQNVYKRFAVVFAGPAFNFMFAIFAYWLMFVVSIPGLKPVIGEVISESPAEIAGLKTGYEIISVNGKQTPVLSVVINSMLPALLEQSAVTVTAKKQDGLITKYQLDFKNIDPDEALSHAFKAVGIYPWQPIGPPNVIALSKGKPAENAGFKVGDLILRIDDTEITSARKLVRYVSSRPNEKLNFVVARNSAEVNIMVIPAAEKVDGKTIGRIGLMPGRASYPEEMKITYQYSLLPALSEAVKKVWVNTNLMLSTFGKMIVGSVSIDKISGPITIAQYAGMSANSGFSTFVSFLAIVSISLGLINLFPIPILDGGHLFYYLIEMVKGSPVSESFEMIGQRIGIIFIAMLMFVAIYNDVLRLFR